MKANDITKAVEGATKKWAKMRRSEERGSRRPRQYVYSDRVNFTDVAHEILPDAYAHASGDGKYTVPKRNFYYACREAFRAHTGREIEWQYFSQTLLPQYMNQNQAQTASWKITADPRGTLKVPNAGHDVSVPVGTLDIDDHLRKARTAVDPFDFDPSIDIEWPSLREGQRYQGVLYIEKEGFNPMLEEAKIAERFDLAIISCKGQSVVAARQYVDEVCRVGGGVPLFIVHDFDKYGFEIAQCLTKESLAAVLNDRVKYRFQHTVNYTDLGLRLADAEDYELESERCACDDVDSIRNSTTDAEREYLLSGRRIELNAFTAPQFIEWLEAKLSEHLPKRLTPTDDVLHDAYRRALAVAKINKAIEDVAGQAIEDAQAAKVPKTLRRQLKKAMTDNPGAAWDRVLYDMLAEREGES